MELSRDLVYKLYWKSLLEGGIRLLQRNYLDTAELKENITDKDQTLAIYSIHVDLDQMINLFEALVETRFRVLPGFEHNSIALWKFTFSSYQGAGWKGRVDYDAISHLRYDSSSWLFQEKEKSMWEFEIEFLVRNRNTFSWRLADLKGVLYPGKSIEVYDISNKGYLPVSPNQVKLDPVYQNTPIQRLLTSREIGLLEIDPRYTGPRYNRRVLFHIPYITGHWNDYEYTWALGLRVL